MGFKTIEEPKVAIETKISDDGNFKLKIDPFSEWTKYGITVEKIEVCPGSGWGRTVAEALKNSRASMVKTAGTIQERLAEIDRLIAEEESKGSEA